MPTFLIFDTFASDDKNLLPPAATARAKQDSDTCASNTLREGERIHSKRVLSADVTKQQRIPLLAVMCMHEPDCMIADMPLFSIAPAIKGARSSLLYSCRSRWILALKYAYHLLKTFAFTSTSHASSYSILHFQVLLYASSVSLSLHMSCLCWLCAQIDSKNGSNYANNRGCVFLNKVHRSAAPAVVETRRYMVPTAIRCMVCYF